MMIFWGSMLALLLMAGIVFWQRPITTLTLYLWILLPIVSLSLYAYWGNNREWFAYEKTQQLPKNLPSVNQIIRQLQSDLVHKPNSAEGWYLLGRLYASQQRFADAQSAFAKANTLKPNQINTLLNYAEALFMQQQSSNTHQIEALLSQALKIDPQNDMALNLLALNFYQQHAYAKAISIWEALSEKYPPNTPDGQALLTAIAEAQKKMGQ